MESTETQQMTTLRLFLALWLSRPVWPGTLLVGIGLNDTGRALALAALAVGAAGLFLESDPASLHAARREGCCTFSVSTLEEAVRALKNEVRQGRAITVALRGNEAESLTGMSRRGVQPELIACTLEKEAALPFCEVFIERGSIAIQGLGLACAASGLRLDEALLSGLGPHAGFRTEVAANLAERRRLDEELLKTTEAATGSAAPVRVAAQRWLRVAPTLFPRSVERAYVTEESGA